MRAGGWGPENPNTHLSTCNIFCVVQIKKCYSNEILLEYKPIFIKKACVICLHYVKYYTLIDEKLLCFILMNFKSKYIFWFMICSIKCICLNLCMHILCHIVMILSYLFFHFSLTII